MTDPSHKVAAAAVPITFDKKEYYMVPLQDVDYIEWEAWIRDSTIALATRNIELLTKQADRDGFLRAAIDKASACTIYSRESINLMTTPEGQARLIWMSLRHRHPDIEIEQVRKWTTDHTVIRAAMGKIDFLNGFNKPDPKAPTVRSGARNQRRQRRKKKRSR